jgi:prepilin-type N-terminal cleavage/methylation domain-containing protein
MLAEPDIKMPNMKKSKRLRTRLIGMTLVEVLVALMVLSIALLAYLTALQGGNVASQKASYIAIATRAASDQIALAQLANTSLLTLGTTTYTVSGLPSGSMTVVLSSNLSSNNGSLVEVDVTVTWSGTTNAPSLGGNVTMSTYVCAKR